jgi:5-bromo-4-chloroindolyl phosphate hydrolysis protein
MAEQRCSEARIRYMAAKSHAPKMGRPMIEDEEKEYRRARIALEEANHKLKTIEQALLELPRLVEQSSNRVRMSRRYAQDLTPKAVATLDVMIEGVQNYLNQMGGKPAGDQS